VPNHAKRSQSSQYDQVLVADDHAIVRRGLKLIMEEEFHSIVFGEASNGQEALDLVWKQDWDIVVLDITMPGRSGLDILKELKQLRPKLPVLVLSMHSKIGCGARVEGRRLGLYDQGKCA
jgi:DNA-binding NarL/FixJ family response regulator